MTPKLPQTLVRSFFDDALLLNGLHRLLVEALLYYGPVGDLVFTSHSKVLRLSFACPCHNKRLQRYAHGYAVLLKGELT